MVPSYKHLPGVLVLLAITDLLWWLDKILQEVGSFKCCCKFAIFWNGRLMFTQLPHLLGCLKFLRLHTPSFFSITTKQPEGSKFSLRNWISDGHWICPIVPIYLFLSQEIRALLKQLPPIDFHCCDKNNAMTRFYFWFGFVILPDPFFRYLSCRVGPRLPFTQISLFANPRQCG